MLDLLTNAGAIFLGAASPVSLGDYLAGSNHVLPTGGQARFSSGLGAMTYLRSQQVIQYDQEALRAVAEPIVTLSRAEDLPAHGDAVNGTVPATVLRSGSTMGRHVLPLLPLSGQPGHRFPDER